MAADLPPRSDPAKSQFFLPMAIARMPLSAVLLSGIRRRSTRFFLNGVKLRDAPDRLFGNGRALGLLHIDELAADFQPRCAGEFWE